MAEIDYERIAVSNKFSVDRENGDEGQWAYYNWYLYFGTDYIFDSAADAYKAACVDYNLKEIAK